LLPYIYTSVEEMTRTGIPLMRPLLLEYPQSPEFFDDDGEFLFGPNLFVSPITNELQDARVIQLPRAVGTTTGRARKLPTAN